MLAVGGGIIPQIVPVKRDERHSNGWKNQVIFLWSNTICDLRFCHYQVTRLKTRSGGIKFCPCLMIANKLSPPHYASVNCKLLFRYNLNATFKLLHLRNILAAAVSENLFSVERLRSRLGTSKWDEGYWTCLVDHNYSLVSLNVTGCSILEAKQS